MSGERIDSVPMSCTRSLLHERVMADKGSHLLPEAAWSGTERWWIDTVIESAVAAGLVAYVSKPYAGALVPEQGERWLGRSHHCIVQDVDVTVRYWHSENDEEGGYGTSSLGAFVADHHPPASEGGTHP